MAQFRWGDNQNKVEWEASEGVWRVGLDQFREGRRWLCYGELGRQEVCEEMKWRQDLRWDVRWGLGHQVWHHFELQLCGVGGEENNWAGA